MANIVPIADMRSDAVSRLTDTGRIVLTPVEAGRAIETVGLITADASLAETVRTALEARREGHIDLLHTTPSGGLDQLLKPGLTAVMVDVEPGEAGCTRLQRLAAVGPDAPIVALIRNADDAAMLSALEAGAAECVTIAANGGLNGADLAQALLRAETRRRAENRRRAPARAAADAQAKPMVLVQEAPDAMIVLDRHGAVAFVNPAAEELLGRSAAELLDRPFDLDLGKGGEVTIVQPGGETRIAEVEVVATERGGVPARVATFTDITVRRKLESALKSAQGGRDAALKRSARFFSRVSHDLRTPLTHILGFAEMLRDERFGKLGHDQYTEYAASIHDAGRLMLDMVEDLLSVVDHPAADVSEPCDLGKLVRNTARFVQGTGPEIVVDAPREPMIAKIDLVRLQRAVYRLTAGIARAAGDQAVLRLMLRQVGQQARLTIRLDGTSGNPVALPGGLEDSDPLVSPADARTGFAAELVREALDAHGGALQLVRDGEAVIAAVLTLPLKR